MPRAQTARGCGTKRRMTNEEERELRTQLARLLQEHRDLDAAIDRLQLDPETDELTIKRLKKRRLQLKDCIAKLESALIPDEPA